MNTPGALRPGVFLYPASAKGDTYVTANETKPCLREGCKPYPKRPGGTVDCAWHWLLRQSPTVQAEAAAERLRLYRASGQQNRPRVVPQLWPEGERWCSGCQGMVPLFYTTGSRCKSCASAAAHAARVEETYGLAPGQYDAIFAAQGGRCAICGNKPMSQRLAVDHDHRTSVVRGLLCQQCNHDVLGGAHDRLDILKAAVAYLQTPPASDARAWRRNLVLSGVDGLTPPTPFKQPDKYVSARSHRHARRS